METTIIVHEVDKMGRIVIPREIRKQLNVDSFEIYMDGEKVILEKHKPTCIFCDSPAESVQYKDCYVCKDCIENLNDIKDTAE